MYRLTVSAALLVFALVALSIPLVAQQTGSIVGTVADQTGAVVPNANVTLTNTETKDTRHTITNGEGFFAFSGTVAGDYSVKIESSGFQPAEQTGIHLSPGDRRNLNVSLAVGTASEHVTIEVNASQVQVVDSGDLSSTLDAKNIRNLALQGRDVTELVRTLPGFNNNTSYNGVQNKTGYDTQITSIASSVGRGYTANGTPDRAGGADLVSDGAHILDPGCACNANQTINADMVQEVKVSTSAYSADSVTGPVVVSAVSKSGSSEYHGAAYFHFRDSAMNSNDWIYNHQIPMQPRPNDRYWYPGGQLGGPVPFTHKKLTFFTGYEYYNQAFPEQTISSGLIKAMVPTLSERAGHFDPTLPDNAAVCSAIASWISGQYRCQPFTTIDTANGVVTSITNEDVSAYLAPGAQALLSMIPKPNHTPTSNADYNYVQPIINTNNGYMFHTRVDYSMNDSTKLYVSYNQQHELFGTPIMRWWAPGNALTNPGDAAYSNISRTISGNLVKVFNSTTTNEFLAGLSFLNGPITYQKEKAVDKAAQGYPYKAPGLTKVMPSILNQWWTGDLGIPMLLDGDMNSYLSRKMQPSITDNFTKVFGTHTLKAGVSWFRSGNRQANVNQIGGANGTAGYGPIWDFNGPPDSKGNPTQITSAYNPVLNFMLDFPATFAYQPDTIADMSASSYGFYIQDDWKASKRLTLTLGLRATHDTPWADVTGKVGVTAWTREWYDADLAAGITNLPGIRWHAMDKSIPLGGRKLDSLFYAPRFGIAYDLFGTGRTVLRGGFGTYYYKDNLAGYDAAVGIAMGGSTCSTTTQTFLPQIDAGKNLACASTGGGLTKGIAADPNDHTEPLTYSYNFTVSQQTIWNSLLELTYSGSQSSNLINPLQNMNAIPLGAFAKPDPNPSSANYGQYMPISKIQGSVLQDYRPLTHYTEMDLIRHGAWANYNALEVSWQKQRGSLTYNLNYTWSKTLGINGQNNTQPDPINLNNDYGFLSQDRTHVFNASYSYEVGNRFHGFAAWALNGWLISGITGLQSGAPLQQSFSSVNFGLGGSNSLSSNNTVNSTYYLGSSDYKLMPALGCDPTQGLGGGQYINPNCFSLPAAPQFNSNGVLTQLGGQGQYLFPYLRGPAYLSSDLSLARTIKITERQNVQIKFTGINFLNHPLKSFDQNNANNINLNYTNSVLAVQGTGWKYGYTNEKFGRRVLEMSLRYNF